MKIGFIYLWYDRKRKMYYIGSHWGTEDDGYICSNNRMRDAYRRRPQDFKRRILKTNIERSILLDEEYKWIQLISDEELGKKYYNLRKHKWGHWSHDKDSKLTTSQKISKAKLNKPGTKHTEESKRKIKEARSKQKMKKGYKLSEETKEKMRNPKKPISDEHRKKISLSKQGSVPWNKNKIIKPNSTNYSTIYMRSYKKGANNAFEITKDKSKKNLECMGYR